MSARVLDGMALGKTIRAEVAAEVARLAGDGRTPGLAAVLVGEDPASRSTCGPRARPAEEAGMHSVTHPPAGDDRPRPSCSAIVDRLNADPTIHGILVQLPLPKHIDSERVLHRVDPAKDVDGFHPVNVGKLVTGDRDGFRPATPYGVQQMLIRCGIETKGAHAVIVGRSNIVGQADGEPAAPAGPGRRRDRHRLPLAHPRPPRGHPHGRHPRSWRSARPEFVTRGHGASRAPWSSTSASTGWTTPSRPKGTAWSATWRSARCAEVAGCDHAGAGRRRAR